MHEFNKILKILKKMSKKRDFEEKDENESDTPYYSAVIAETLSKVDGSKKVRMTTIEFETISPKHSISTLLNSPQKAPIVVMDEIIPIIATPTPENLCICGKKTKISNTNHIHSFHHQRHAPNCKCRTYCKCKE